MSSESKPDRLPGHARLGFFASHGGSNMQAIIDACKKGRLDAEAKVVICNNRGAEALNRARRAGIPAYLLNGKTHPEPDALDREIRRVLRKHEVDLVILAGYMRKLGPKTLAAFRNRVLNIHPALLPRYGGKGMYGIRVHEAVLRSGDSETGVTIHLCNENYDEGAILAQKSVPVLAHDNPELLAERVLELEHEIYVETISRIVRGELALPGRGGGS